MTPRVALVVPRFAASLVGGMERLARGLALQMQRRGWQVEVWTTCALDHHSFENVLPVGPDTVDGLPVRRFPVVWRNRARHAELERHLTTVGTLAAGDEDAWLESGPHSPALYAHIRDAAPSHDLLVCLPYAAPMVQAAAWFAPDRVLFIPCLHEEPYAALRALRELLGHVWGVAFNSPEEAALATNRLGIRPRRHAVLGVGVDTLPPTTPEPPSNDLLLYCGRLEAGKNVAVLYEYVERLHAEGSRVRLAVMGEGPLHPPRHPAFEWLHRVTEHEKTRWYGRALAHCQPSLRESFSLTVMESWRAGRPVLVHGACDVTRAHVRRASAGLWFHNYEEFRATVAWLQRHPALAARMGQNGARYVARNYEWPQVMDRLERFMSNHSGGPS